MKISKILILPMLLGAGFWASSVDAQDFDAKVEISAADLVRDLRAKKKMHILEGMVDQKLSTVIKKPRVLAKVTALFHSLLETANPELLSRLPLLPIRDLEELRSALQLQDDGSRPMPKGAVGGELQALMRMPVTLEPDSVVLSEELPSLRRGNLPHPLLSQTYKENSYRLAKILTSLASGRVGGVLSSVTYNGKSLESPAELIRELINTGHRVEMYNQRTLANFIALIYEGKSVRWPGWIDTGFTIKGENLVVPMGHSQLVYEIIPPPQGASGGLRVEGRVAFFLGVSGVGYFPDTSQRPHWTGLKNLAEYSSSKASDLAEIMRALSITADYQKLIVREAKSGVPNADADGYGYTGVCNDSAAIFDRRAYPLMRDPDLDAAYRGRPAADGLGKVIDLVASLPKDGSDSLEVMDVFARIQAMNPFALASNDFIDAKLKNQMQILNSVLNP